MRFSKLTFTFALVACFCAGQTPEQTEFFEKKIRPVLVQNCQGCHNAKAKTAGLDLSSVDGFVHGGPSGALVSKDDPQGSLLLRVVSYDDKLKMPPMRKLKDEELADLKTWVSLGAPWPGATLASSADPAAKPKNTGRKITDADRAFWSFRPVQAAAPPQVKDAGWVKTPIDRFILAKLEEKGLKPAPASDKLTLLRRVTFDLTGLPPTEAEIQSFLSDPSTGAYEKVVDRLLASPRYGEKWGREWLDVARYADSTGNDEDHRYPHAWRYRDYVINAFNSDLPYDQFVREQIAGDLLPAKNPGELNRRGIIATGFLALGAKAIAQQDKKKMLYDVYDEQVDVTSKAFLGLTLACARCHDHKFDPLLTKDYYSMAGMFASTRSFKNPDLHVSTLLFTPLVPAQDYKNYTHRQEMVSRKAVQIEDLIDEQIERRTAALPPRLADYMVAARRVYEEGGDLAVMAKEQDLRPEVLKKWIDYLHSEGESRAHLADWRKVTAETAPAVAKAYQTDFEKQLSAWLAKLSKWRAEFRKAEADMAVEAPAKPKFEPSDDRFFYEVYMQGPFATAKEQREKDLPAEVQTTIAALRKEHQELKAALPPEPDMACAVQEGAPVQQKVFVRGDYNAPGPDAPKEFPVVLAGYDQTPVQKGSGRLELAQWLTRPDNPLTARVMVNRIWLGHFGEGLVRTPDNFGKMGERPTHPELLDYLATEFVRSGWSVKTMHRSILLSNAYQMSSNVTEEVQGRDPENKLFSRFPRRRLTVEELRDGLLAADGSIDYTMGGTLQSGTGTDGENSSGRLSIRPESSRRRLVYLPLRRANLPTMLNLFDFGDATTMSGKRALTTVAPQALFMMNSEFVAERAKNLSASALKEPGDAAAHLRKLYLDVLNREPTPQEVDGGLTYLARFQEKFSAKRNEADAWLSLTRALIASNEFIYLD